MSEIVKIGIAPSKQFHNVGKCPGYIEGDVMGSIGAIATTLLNKVPGIEARMFWSREEDNWIEQADAAADWADYVVAFHTDSAGDPEGFTGSLLCYSRNDPRGRALGWAIIGRMKTDFAWPIKGEQERSDSLHMFQYNDIPACLLEIGNHSDADDCKLILQNQNNFATSIVNGICGFFGIQPIEPEEDEPVLDSFHDSGPHSWLMLEIGKTNSDYHVHFAVRDDKADEVVFPVKVWTSIKRDGKFINEGEKPVELNDPDDIGWNAIPADYTGPVKVTVEDTQPANILIVGGRYDT